MKFLTYFLSLFLVFSHINGSAYIGYKATIPAKIEEVTEGEDNID